MPEFNAHGGMHMTVEVYALCGLSSPVLEGDRGPNKGPCPPELLLRGRLVPGNCSSLGLGKQLKMLG